MRSCHGRRSQSGRSVGGLAPKKGSNSSESATDYNCPWKGDAQYFDVTANDSSHHDAAWSYPRPYPASFDRVGRDYSGYVAFDKRQVALG
jgi:uncharacterized protein (DUF427 family)